MLEDGHVAPRLSVAPTSMGSSPGFLPGGRTMVRSGFQGVRGPLGAVAPIDSGVLFIANGSILRSCGYDQQRVNIYEEFIYICTVHVELRNKPHIVHHAPSKDENTRQV